MAADAEVGHHAADHLSVRHDEGLFTRRRQDGIEDLNFLHAAEVLFGDLHPVAHPVGPEEDDDDARREVVQAPLQRQANGETGRGQHGDKARYVDAQDAGDGEEQQHFERDPDQGTEEGRQVSAQSVLAHRLNGHRHHLIDDADADEQDDDGEHDFRGVLDDHIPGRFQVFLQRFRIHGAQDRTRAEKGSYRSPTASSSSSTG